MVSGGQFAASAVLMTLVYPVMLNELGVQMFGWWAVLTSPMGLTAVAGIGLQPAVVSLLGRSLGRARAANGESGNAAQHVSRAGSYALAGLILSGLAALAALVVGWWLAPMAVQAINVPVDETASALLLLRASVVNLAVMVFSAAITAQAEAANRVDLTALSMGVLKILTSLLMLVAVVVAPGFPALAAVVMINALLTFAFAVATLHLSGASSLVHWYALTPHALRELGRLCLTLGSGAAIGSLIEPVLKWVVGIVSGPVPVAAYELASRLVGIVSGLFRSFLSPLTAHLALTQGEAGNSRSVRSKVVQVSRVNSLIAFPTLVALAVGSYPLLEVWLGDNTPPGSAWSIVVLCMGSMVSLGAVPAYGALLSAGSGTRILLVQIFTALACGVSGLVILSTAGAGEPAWPAMAVGGGMAVGGLATMLFYGRMVGEHGTRDSLGALTPALGMSMIVAVGGVLCALLVTARPLIQLVCVAAIWLLTEAAVFARYRSQTGLGIGTQRES